MGDVTLLKVHKLEDSLDKDLARERVGCRGQHCQCTSLHVYSSSAMITDNVHQTHDIIMTYMQRKPAEGEETTSSSTELAILRLTIA